jgi:anaerobic ribonucleoside-triphosphate reductase activating protein
MNVWVYTGFTYEELLKNGSKDILEFLSEIDVLIDGKFDPSKKSLDLEFRGSSNQRIIDVKKSLENHDVILFDLKNKKTETKKEKLYI